MIQYYIEYKICQKYEYPIKTAILQAMLIPATTKNQKVGVVEVTNSLALSHYEVKNVFGFSQYMFSVSQPIQEVELLMKAQVTVHERKISTFLDAENEQEKLNELAFQIKHHLYLFPTSLTTLSESILQTFPVLEKEEQVYSFLKRVDIDLKEKFIVNDGEDVCEDLTEVCESKIASLKDIAHVFISACRHQGIPCRYVMGYLYQADMETHQMDVWVEVFIPQIGWLGWNLTQGDKVNGQFIKIAHGTDYNDCVPIKSVFQENQQSKTECYIKIVNQ